MKSLLGNFEYVKKAILDNLGALNFDLTEFLHFSEWWILHKLKFRSTKFVKMTVFDTPNMLKSISRKI